ncbi:hypothetical protein [Rhodanobacter sp. DHG33]|uniref:hypothetical protein n=1 Tax=Rhodanobacter sp. DHG33 TaxID=2775921 RepID=UPI00177B1867|nr:hypothetical protein [Rhodanobacter sp. DHG33]MBD8897797.1 hypothetical protein [Rhodanobacter sp. DHG33]
MSPSFAPARMFQTPAIAGRTLLAAGGIAATATIITTGTGTTGSGWVSVRE